MKSLSADTPISNAKSTTPLPICVVTKGMPVEAKTPLVLLDAMKMDTYIYAPRTGTIAEVCVEVGAAVQVRDPLIRYAPEG